LGENGLRKTKLEDIDQEERAEALRIKSEANKLFVASKYNECLQLYTLSLNKNPFDPAVWCNRAATRLKLEEHGLAIADATKAIELDPKYVKAYFRRAVAQLSIMRPKAALADLKKVVALEPKNVQAKAQMDSTQKLVRRLEFEKAIAGKDEVSMITRAVDLLANGMEVEADYAGPKMETEDDGKGKKRAKITKEYIDEMKAWFKDGKTIARRHAWEIVLGAYDALSQEPSLVDVTIPEGEVADIVGDTHGQYFDLMHLFEMTGDPSESHTMVFNGDFVDRGSWSTEVVLLLFAYKWLYPKNVFLNRGNHETSDMNKVYGFEGETKKKYSELTFKVFDDAFTALPIATLVTASQAPRELEKRDTRLPVKPFLSPAGRKRYFIVHGGLYSKDGVKLEDVKRIERMRIKQPGTMGLMSESLWADPQDLPGRGPSKRGVGLGFGPDITRKFLELNGVCGVIRSHEVRQNGYSVEHGGQCITVFSAPNYVDQVGNLAGVVRIDDAGDLTFTTFSAQPHPDIKPMAYAGGFGGMM